MDIDNHQKKAKSTAVYPFIGKNLIYVALSLAGEAGEFANEIKKIIRKYHYKQGDSIDKIPSNVIHKLEYELGDIGWYWFLTAMELGTNSSYIAQLNHQKLEERAKENKVIDHE